MSKKPIQLKYSLESLPELLGRSDFNKLVLAIQNGVPKGDEFIMSQKGDKGEIFAALVNCSARVTCTKKAGD